MKMFRQVERSKKSRRGFVKKKEKNGKGVLPFKSSAISLFVTFP